MKNKLTLLMSTFIAVFFCCMLYITPALAKDVDIWADDRFDFKKINSVAFDEIYSDCDTEAFEDDMLVRKIDSANNQIAAKAKLNVIEPMDNMPGDSIKFTVTFERWDSHKQWHEPYTSWERRSATREKRDSNGRKTTETYYYDVPVHHPGYYSYWSHVQVRYDGYSSDGKLVYTHREARNREDGDAHYKMYERITKDFASRFAKYIR
ncbi:MAG: hypothetical protein Q4D21_04565 [Phascolarctobacterium sp.]|nr:hypothetical protein [Phascolarctobacterium sp.]